MSGNFCTLLELAAVATNELDKMEKEKFNKKSSDLSDFAIKKLVSEYSVIMANEVKKQFAVQCAFLPGECDQIFRSYGNENEAEKKMKEHFLKEHKDLIKRKLNGTWPPKVDLNISPESTVKSVRKRRKAQHPSGIKLPTKSPKTLKSKTNVQTKISNGYRPSNVKAVNVNSHSDESSKNSFKFGSVTMKPSRQGFSVCIEEDDGKMVVEEIIQDSTLEICGPLCDHSSCYKSQPSTSQNGQCVVYGRSKESDCKLPLTPQRVILNEYLYFSTEQEANQYKIAVEHSYASKRGVKVEQPAPKIKVGRKQTTCRLAPECVIRTPPFPYIYTPLLPDCAQVEEIVAIDCFTDDRNGNIDNNSSDTRDAISDVWKVTKTTVRKGKKEIKNNRNSIFSGSVLECVENRVDINSSSVTRMPVCAHENVENNIENAENLQKRSIRLRALECLEKLRFKKKKLQGPVECELCEKTFTAYSTLAHHLRGHAGIKPFICRICKNKFTRKHSLNYHLMIHNNKSRFFCKQCYREFRHPSHFKEHLRRHTGETPFQCKICLPIVKFKTRNTYKRHLKMTHKIRLTKENEFEDMRNE